MDLDRDDHKDRIPYVRLAAADNVVVLTRNVAGGDTFAGDDGSSWTMREPIDTGNKLAARAVAAGEKVIKLGMPIGTATSAIAAGELVHTHNLRSDYLAIELETAGEGDVSAN